MLASLAEQLPHIAAEFGWALVIGVCVGIIYILYLRFVRREVLLFSLAVMFVTSFVCARLHAETLLAFLIVCGGVLTLRATRPDVERPFRVPAVWIVAPLGIASSMIVRISDATAEHVAWTWSSPSAALGTFTPRSAAITAHVPSTSAASASRSRRSVPALQER